MNSISPSASARWNSASVRAAIAALRDVIATTASTDMMSASASDAVTMIRVRRA